MPLFCRRDQYFCNKNKNMRYKKFEEIPGVFERGLNCIGCADRDKAIFSAKLAVELCNEYNMTTAYFSTRGTAKEFEKLYYEGYSGRKGKIYAEDLEDTDCDKLCDKLDRLIKDGAIQSFIVDCLEDLDIQDFKGGIRAKRSEIRTRLQFSTYGCPAVLLCRPGKSLNPEECIQWLGRPLLYAMEEVSYVKNQK